VRPKSGPWERAGAELDVLHRTAGKPGFTPDNNHTFGALRSRSLRTVIHSTYLFNGRDRLGAVLLVFGLYYSWCVAGVSIYDSARRPALSAGRESCLARAVRALSGDILVPPNLKALKGWSVLGHCIQGDLIRCVLVPSSF
jgi:hypothetical protein